MRSKATKRSDGRAWGRLAPGLSALAMAVLLMKHTELASEAVGRGLVLCARVMIPSLFPFMVIAELTVRSGVGRVVARPVARLLKHVFGVGEAGSCALVLGALCGFPVGARVAAAYYRGGELDTREFNHVLCFCNVPSSAFLIGAVGHSLFGDARIGRAMLALCLGAAALIGLLFRFLLPHRVAVSEKPPPVSVPDNGASGSLLSASIASAAGGMQSVCATVLVFSALVGVLGQYADALGLSDVARGAVFGLLELSTGVAEASAFADAKAAAVLCAAMAGWAGLSVHCQILSVCDGCPLALVPFWISRLLQGLLCGGGMWLLIRTGLLEVQGVTHGASVGAWAQTGLYGRIWQAVCMIGFLAATAAWLSARRGEAGHEAKTVGRAR